MMWYTRSKKLWRGILSVLLFPFLLLPSYPLALATTAPGSTIPGSTIPGSATPDSTTPNARAVIAKALDHVRGITSISKLTMTIHRPDFERSMTLRVWTAGMQDALFFIEKPKRDAGNGTLKKGRQMWSFNPKVNRVIKLPPSMMSQAWMGSDFSNNDLSKSDSILEDYTHRITGKSIVRGLTTYRIESIPKEEAPVVWGKQETTIRDDGILLRQAFYDEDMVLVKEMLTRSITMLGGRPFAKVWVMRKAEEADRHTTMVYEELEFDTPLKPGLFTLTSLKTRRH